MSRDPVRAALEKASKQFCVCDGECFETRHGMMHGPCEQMVGQAATVIAAFLRALPTWHDINGRSVSAAYLHILAAAVEAAAKGEK